MSRKAAEREYYEKMARDLDLQPIPFQPAPPRKRKKRRSPRTKAREEFFDAGERAVDRLASAAISLFEKQEQRMTKRGQCCHPLVMALYSTPELLTAEEIEQAKQAEARHAAYLRGEAPLPPEICFGRGDNAPSPPKISRKPRLNLSVRQKRRESSSPAPKPEQSNEYESPHVAVNSAEFNDHKEDHFGGDERCETPPSLESPMRTAPAYRTKYREAYAAKRRDITQRHLECLGSMLSGRCGCQDCLNTETPTVRVYCYDCKETLCPVEDQRVHGLNLNSLHDRFRVEGHDFVPLQHSQAADLTETWTPRGIPYDQPCPQCDAGPSGWRQHKSATRNASIKFLALNGVHEAAPVTYVCEDCGHLIDGGPATFMTCSMKSATVDRATIVATEEALDAFDWNADESCESIISHINRVTEQHFRTAAIDEDKLRHLIMEHRRMQLGFRFDLNEIDAYDCPICLGAGMSVLHTDGDMKLSLFARNYDQSLSDVYDHDGLYFPAKEHKRTLAELTGEQASLLEDTCSSHRFRAMKDESRPARPLDITGQTIATCPHMLGLKACELTAGERYSSHLFLALNCMKKYTIRNHALDIGCRYRQYVEKNVSKFRNAFDVDVPYPNVVVNQFHSVGHGWECQARNSILIKGDRCGKVDGESGERMNSRLGRVAASTRNGTPGFYRGRYRYVVAKWNDEMLGSAPKVLVARVQRAVDGIEEAKTKKIKVMSAPELANAVTELQASAEECEVLSTTKTLQTFARSRFLLRYREQLQKIAKEAVLFGDTEFASAVSILAESEPAPVAWRRVRSLMNVQQDASVDEVDTKVAEALAKESKTDLIRWLAELSEHYQALITAKETRSALGPAISRCKEKAQRLLKVLKVVEPTIENTVDEILTDFESVFSDRFQENEVVKGKVTLRQVQAQMALARNREELGIVRKEIDCLVEYLEDRCRYLTSQDPSWKAADEGEYGLHEPSEEALCGLKVHRRLLFLKARDRLRDAEQARQQIADLCSKV